MTRLRTTSFRLTPALFGHVFVYKAGPRYQAAWRRIEQALGVPNEQRRLPEASLRAALTAASGDLVIVQARLGDQDPYAIISRRRIDAEDLYRVLRAWEQVVWPTGATGELAQAAEDLQVERVPVEAFVGRRAGRCPAPSAKWIWNVAHWEIAHQLAQHPLRVDQGKQVRLQLDSEGCLLTWDDLVRAERCAAMHIIVPKLITVPGLEDPVIHLQSSLVRMPNRLTGRVKHAWMSYAPNQLLLYAGIDTWKENGQWMQAWSERALEVLRRCSPGAFPMPSEVPWEQFAAVRGRYSSAPTWYPIGAGPGQIFHEAVAVHAHEYLTGAIPVEMVKALTRLSPSNRIQINESGMNRVSVESGIAATGARALQLTCLYGADDTRLRMRRALGELLGGGEGGLTGDDESPMVFGNLQIVFRSPPGALGRLRGEVDRVGLEAWLRQVIGPTSSSPALVRAVLVETGDPKQLRGSEQDPKHVIRRILAQAGIVSQFLVGRPSDGTDQRGRSTEDYASQRALWDLLRSAGVFPKPFPNAASLDATPWLVGTHVVQRRSDMKSGFRRQRGEGFVVSLVATKAGSRTALGFDPQAGWLPLGSATARFLAASHNRSQIDTANLIDTALAQLLVQHPDDCAVLFVDACACRRLWNGLQDTGGTELPRSAMRDRVAIVRVRSAPHEVPRPAAKEAWPEAHEPGKPGLTNALYRLEAGPNDGAVFFVSTSRTLESRGEHRNHTRFSASGEGLTCNWHAMTATEFWVPSAGPFTRESLVELAALLCLHAPTWDGTLDQPSPLHLAQALVLDHPDKYEVREQETESLEDAA